MDGLKWKIRWKWMIWGENLHYFWKHPYIHTFCLHTKKRQTALNQDAGLEYDFFTWNSAISTLEKRRRWQEHRHRTQKKKVWWIICKKPKKQILKVVVSCHHFLGKNCKQENIATFFCRKVRVFCWCPCLFWGWVILLTYPPENQHIPLKIPGWKMKENSEFWMGPLFLGGYHLSLQRGMSQKNLVVATQIFFMFNPIWGRWTHFDYPPGN